MPAVVGRKSLWTPQGEKPFEAKDQVLLTQPQLAALSFLHEWAFKYELTITCKRCNSAVVGRNSDSEVSAGKHPTVACQCTEWVYIPGTSPRR